MKIQYASDLHLEFSENRAFLKEHPIKPIGDILVLAGDIVLFKVMERHQDFFDYCADHFEATYWVPGNHEYYSSSIISRTGAFQEDIKSNVHLVNNVKIKHGDVNLLFSTLWSYISPIHQWEIESGLNDFRVIRNGNRRFNVNDYNRLHSVSRYFLENNLDDENTVVVTHHAPTLMNYPEQYRGSTLNEAFAVELFDLIERKQPAAWIYGHTHGNIPDFTIGKTQLLTNQLGYIAANEHLDYGDKVLLL